MNFGSRLRECRKAKKLRQVDLGRKVGVTGQVISNLERGYTTGSSPEMLKDIADALDVSVEYLTGSENINTTSLTSEDEKDISKTLNTLMEQIRANENSPLNYDGIELTDQDTELLEDAIEIALRRIKKKSKKKGKNNKR